jgi:anti-sigma regulatory factor (Ser/Thr protein kinase)
MGQPRRLTVPGQFEQLAQIAEFVTRAAREAGMTDDDVFHVEMAVDEACSNVIEHAYADCSGDIDLTCTSSAPGSFEIAIHDSGRSFNPDGVALPPLDIPADVDDLNEGGLGLYLMRKLMDEVRFEMAAGQGNTLTMTKRSKQLAV